MSGNPRRRAVVDLKAMVANMQAQSARLDWRHGERTGAQPLWLSFVPSPLSQRRRPELREHLEGRQLGISQQTEAATDLDRLVNCIMTSVKALRLFLALISLLLSRTCNASLLAGWSIRATNASRYTVLSRSTLIPEASIEQINTDTRRPKSVPQDPGALI